MLHPLKPKLSTKSAFIIFFIIWLIAFASSTPSLIFYNVYFIENFGYQCLPYTSEHQESNSTLRSNDVHKIYIVYNIYSQYVIPFIIISCAYFRIAAHLYFSKPVGQTKHQEVIARNKRKVRSYLSCEFWLNMFLINCCKKHYCHSIRRQILEWETLLQIELYQRVLASYLSILIC